MANITIMWIIQFTFQTHNEYIIKAGSLLPKLSDLPFLESRIFQEITIDDHKVVGKKYYLATKNNKMDKQREYVEGERTKKVSSNSIPSEIKVFIIYIRYLHV